MIDILFIIPDSSKETYQALAENYAAVEAPPWAVLLAGAVRKDGYEVAILDPLASRMTDEEAWEYISIDHPRHICFVVYGQNPNSGTTNMAGAIRLARYMKKQGHHIPVTFIGSHPSAEPDKTLNLDKPNFIVDYVCPGDGLNGLRKILNGEVKYRDVVWGEPCKTDELKYAWDLVDLTRYRCHTWHNNFGPDRSPFASIYTSLGCKFKCDFCMINMVNKSRPDQADSSQSTGMRYFSTDYILDQLECLQALGVKNVRFADEMFFFNKRHYLPILEGIIGRGIVLNLWAYARVDTVRPEHLRLFKSAGFNWLCLGIEAGNQTVRREVAKGSFEDVDVRQVCKEIRDAGINLLANFIIGLPEDSEESMQETVALAMELNAEHTNLYPCMALPGSPLYRIAVEQGTQLPADFSGYSFHSYECVPLPTKHCTAGQVLEIRDRAWLTTTLNPDYLALVAEKFGAAQVASIQKQAGIPLKRRLLETHP